MTLVVLIAVVALLLVAGAVGLVVSRGRRKPPTPEGGGSVAATEAGAAPAEPSGGAPAVPTLTLERPEAPAGRLVRLRQRLAGSQSGLGRGLLALLSRDRLDEDTWEQLEDVLITADVGVGPTTELVGRLRTRL